MEGVRQVTRSSTRPEICICAPPLPLPSPSRPPPHPPPPPCDPPPPPSSCPPPHPPAASCPPPPLRPYPAGAPDSQTSLRLANQAGGGNPEDKKKQKFSNCCTGPINIHTLGRKGTFRKCAIETEHRSSQPRLARRHVRSSIVTASRPVDIGAIPLSYLVRRSFGVASSP